MQYNFSWNRIKAGINAQKHQVSFKQAIEVFKDAMALTIFDEDNSDLAEERWITLGQIQNNKYVVVIHTYQQQAPQTIEIRIISARKATRHEIRQYEQR